MILVFLFYRTPSLLTATMIDYGHFSIPLLTVLIVFFQMAGYTIDKRAGEAEKKASKLKEKMKDTKLLLLSSLDPSIRDAVKEIVRKDMK